MRWVSRYSESRMMREGSTIAVRDLLERLPLEKRLAIELRNGGETGLAYVCLRCKTVRLVLT